jgi:hypothetical protein
MKLRLINHALLKRKPVFSSFSSSLFLVSPSYSSPPNTMQVRKTRRGKPEGLGVEKISQQEDQVGAPGVGCSRDRMGGSAHLGEEKWIGVALDLGAKEKEGYF